MVFIMKFVIQRVLEAKVVINKKIYSSINQGLLLLAGFESTDEELNFNYIVLVKIPKKCGIFFYAKLNNWKFRTNQR